VNVGDMFRLKGFKGEEMLLIFKSVHPAVSSIEKERVDIGCKVIETKNMNTQPISFVRLQRHRKLIVTRNFVSGRMGLSMVSKIPWKSIEQLKGKELDRWKLLLEL